MPQKPIWTLFALALLPLLTSCAKQQLILKPVSQAPLPRVSVDMPRSQKQITDDVELTLSDLDSKQQAAREQLTP